MVRSCFIPQRADAPTDAWVYDLASQNSQQVTHSLVAGLRSEDMVQPYLVHYPSRDGKWQISAFVYVPHNLPTQQASPGDCLHSRRAGLADHEFVQQVHSVHGESGLPGHRAQLSRFDAATAKNFRMRTSLTWAAAICRTCWPRRTGSSRAAYVDPKKLIVMGGSYGGYMTMMAVTKAPEMWAAGVPIVPFVNWFTEIENEDLCCRNSTSPPWATP